MTHEILLSDIILAEELIKAGRPDGETVAALVRRGAHPAQAAKLVDDLRAGRPWSGERPAEFASRPEAERGETPEAQPFPPPQRKGKPSPTATDGHESRTEAWCLVAILLVLVAMLGFEAFSNHRYHAQTGSLLDQLDKAGHEVVRLLSQDPSQGLPWNLAQPGAVPATEESDQLGDYRSLLDQVALRELSASEQGRLDAISSKLDGFRVRNRSEFESWPQKPLESEATNSAGRHEPARQGANKGVGSEW